MYLADDNFVCYNFRNTSSMVVFLNMMFLKYKHAHNIHHCALYPISNIGLGISY